jgi:large subunit ribosomal protein L7/L12
MTDTVAATNVSTRVTQIVDLFTQLNVLELLELQSALEAKGIKPAAAAAVAMPMGAAGGAGALAAEAAEEKTTFNVILKGSGDKKIQVIKVVRELTSLGLKEAKDLVEGAPKPVKEGITKEEGEAMVKKLIDAGGDAELK